ncbi:hypothetical protein [Microlunatus elymi]|nr:hypothetical protein [Microlunatus elymi]
MSEEGRRNAVAWFRVTSGAESGRTLVAKQTVGFDSPDNQRGESTPVLP